MKPIDFNQFPTPCYVVDERLIRKNLIRIDEVREQTGCKILLALKGFSMYSLFGLVGEYLAGITASSLHEARLGYEEMGKEVHTYAPAYVEDEFPEIMHYSDHIVFNSFTQWDKYKEQVAVYNISHSKPIQCGIRVNPEYSEVKTLIYNPCAPYSRLGVTAANFDFNDIDELSGLHFHTLCEQNSDALERTFPIFEEKFKDALGKMKWLNLGGGHHISRPDYDIETLIHLILYIKNKYHIEVYIEPGEAIALNTGYLVATVLDIVHNGLNIAILDTSAACHMPDITEMPYRPEIVGAGHPNEFKHTYRLGGLTCLAGDVIGDYSFKEALQPGDRIVFCDMAHYTMVKNNTFNGVNLPSIAVYSEKYGGKLIKSFGYEDYKSRL